MPVKALDVYVGARAAQLIDRQGWQPELFSTLLGASGGPKWFILSQLDRVLFGDFLMRSDQPLSVVGSSIGAWRHACLAMDDPAAAVSALEHGYLYQNYEGKPSPAEVSEVSRGTLEQVLGEHGAQRLAQHPRIHSHIVTARGLGAAGASSAPVLAAAMGAAALGNTVSRQLLRLAFQRVVFHSGRHAQPGLTFDDFATRYSALSNDSVTAALHASASIPFVLAGERDIPGAPAGQYWDGGIIDYHFDLRSHVGSGLMLYPHFSANITPGWFDKFLPWRRISMHTLDNLVLMCPNPEFTAALPFAKIPDRRDFTRLSYEDRVRYWEECILRGKALAEEFEALVAQDEPLRGVTVLT